MNRGGIFLPAFALGLLLLPGVPALAAPAKRAARKAAPAKAAASANRAVVRMSDGSEFRGTVLDNEEGGLISLRMPQGDRVYLPREEIVSINGQGPAAYFRRFTPVVEAGLLAPFEFVPHGKSVACSFKFMHDWDKVGQPSGFVFVAPETDPKWNGYRFYFSFEAPPKLAEPSYAAVLKRIPEENAAVTSESYELARGTRTLVTQESGRAGQLAKTYWQLAQAGGEPCLLRLSLTHASKDKLELPIVKVLLQQVLGSVRFGAPAAQAEQSGPGKAP